MKHRTPPWMDKVPTAKSRSLKQEKRVAKVLDGRTQPRSGAGDHHKGDVLSKWFLVECKTTVGESYRVLYKDLRRITLQTMDADVRLDPAFVVSFERNDLSCVPRDWALIPLDVLKELLKK